MRWNFFAFMALVLGFGFGCQNNGGGQTNNDTTIHQETAEEVAVEVEKETEQETEQAECHYDSECPDDGLVCSMEQCRGGKCYHTPNNVACNDGDACTMDECDLQAGCLHKALTCDDEDPCTANECRPETGCYFGNPNTGACVGLGNECVEAKCVTGVGCQFFPVLCNDGNLSTVDECVVGIGCVHQEVQCGNGFSECIPSSACVNVGCISGKCVETPKDCDDGVTCTQDFCDTNGACQHIGMDGLCPEDGLMCTMSVCQPFFGCGQGQVGCDDNNQCTADFCQEGQGCVSQKIDGCCLDEGDCNDGDPCTGDICGPDHKCGYVPMMCEPDGVGCTVDKAKPQGSQCVCVYEPKDELCGNGFKCSDWMAGCVECEGGQDCDDNDPCTTDSCDYPNYTCSHGKQCNWSGVHCVADPEQNQGFRCEDDPGWCDGAWECDDGNPCTDDICQDHQCVEHKPVVCNPGNLCNVGTCNPEIGGCDFHQKCEDGDPCTEDACDYGTGVCTNLQVLGCVVCSEHGDCPQSGTQVCVSDGKSLIYNGECDAWSHRCSTREWLCTSDLCNIGVCDKTTGGCQSFNRCDDGNACTNDACDNNTGNCTNFGIPGCFPCKAHEECPVAGTQVCISNGKSVQYQGTCDAWQGRCQVNELFCTDNPCQTSRCDSQFGTCVYEDRCVPDTNHCTETCVWGTGECNAPVPGCF